MNTTSGKTKMSEKELKEIREQLNLACEAVEKMAMYDDTCDLLERYEHDINIMGLLSLRRGVENLIKRG